jgi:hypothetical protein
VDNKVVGPVVVVDNTVGFADIAVLVVVEVVVVGQELVLPLPANYTHNYYKI